MLTDANVTASTVTADCGFIDTSFGLSLAGMLLALSGSALARFCVGRHAMLRRVVRLLAGAVGAGTPLVVWALQPTDARAPSPPSAHYLLCAGLALTSVATALLDRAATTTAPLLRPPPPPTPAPTTGARARAPFYSSSSYHQQQLGAAAAHGRKAFSGKFA